MNTKISKREVVDIATFQRSRQREIADRVENMNTNLLRS
jgi:hypothetical protein